MTCQKCGNEGVFVQLQNCQYYYCRTCKDEIQLEVVKQETVTEEDLLREFDRMIGEGNVNSGNYKPTHGGYPTDNDDDYGDYL